MNLDERMASLSNKLNDRLNGNNSDTNCNSYTESLIMFCPECGNKVEEECNFCPHCGHNFSDAMSGVENTDTEIEEFNNGNDRNKGIIMTDTVLLAKKYGVGRFDVQKIVNQFIQRSKAIDFNWYLLDIADHQDEIGEASWMDHSDVLQHFCLDNGIATGPKLSLFILGGNDVIPQPCEDNPCFNPSPWSDDEYQAKVYADFYYCFYGRLQLDFLDFNKARCNVARLPLETGNMESTIANDLGGYFDRIIELGKEGIAIGRAVMTSNEDWIPASREMSRNLPTECMDAEENVVLDNMYISPEVVVNMDDNLRERYYNSLKKADMLVFNLHGACEPQMNGFYSNELAFSTFMLKESNAKIFNTVACWGGRYIKYTRKQSMLLTALYENNVMLYSGACVPAMGKCGHYQHDATWRIQPAAYSENFMARFAEYQCIGTMSAGEAFLKAKCDYYNSSRAIEEDEITLGTVLMFNLYGSPALRTMPNMNAIAEIQNDDGSKMYRVPFRSSKKEVVMQNNDKQQNDISILNAVRSAVDNNFKRMHEIITDKLYSTLGVTPRELYKVERYTTVDINGKPQKGYLYNYSKQRGEYLYSGIRVEVDERGNVIDAIQTK
jgi:hypothetical protein